MVENFMPLQRHREESHPCPLAVLPSPSKPLVMEPSILVPRGSSDMNLTPAERDTLQHIERLGASISLTCVCLIFVAYGLFRRVRTVPNTFIFFASIANVGASIACLIGYSGILAGEESVLCQTQAFLLEMFMQSDPWWSFAMAVNVYVVFFMSYSPNSFRQYLWVYCLVCFGIPAVPAFICLFYAPNGQRIYGDATLWCWINDKYNQLRIFTYYLPIWTCILLSAVIYGAVGVRVFRHRSQLRNLTLSDQASPRDICGGALDSTEKAQASYGTVTTEVQVTAESSGSQTPPSTPAGSIAPVLHKPSSTGPHAPWGSPDDIEPVSPTSRAHHDKPFVTTSTISSTGRHIQEHKKPGLLNKLAQIWNKFRIKLANLDPIKLAYLRTSFVFAISILVTWTPSSINRVYSLMYPTRTSYPLNLAGAVVLPLQGLWNAIIFAATSWPILTDEVRVLRRGGWRGFFGGSRRRRRLGDDPGTQGTLPRFRSRQGSAPESRELPTMSRMANVRVIRGGSL
ncbi:family A G protein-coupled receptor-like protein [Parathielavia appendiculata]|uniref:Family A G protein-coupled receptor-like protein n=1 Tax=Parathielavia appendiculata TaxID=2587402 RepID=A0AAN6Z9C2_9PEZI|nr:family A G protein-coupled receptor-like protein [Parathielavia appendiculata]